MISISHKTRPAPAQGSWSRFVRVVAPAFLAYAATLFADEPATPLSLDQAIATAQKNHPQYAAAQLQTFLAQEFVKETRAGFFPTANGYVTGAGATTEGTRITAGGLNNPTIYDRVAGGLAVSQLITDFGRTSNLTASAKAQARGAAAGAESTREQIILNAETSYFATLQAQSVLSVARQTLASRQLVLKQIKALEDNKLKSSLDVSFAQVAVEEADLLVQQSEGQLESAMASLSTALGYRRQQAFILTEDPEPAGPPLAIEDLIDAALKGRPDLLRLRDQRDAAVSAASAERDANYPTLAAVGTAGSAPWRDSHLPPNYAAGGVQLSIPLFAGGAFVAREHEAQIRAQVADEALREAEDEVARDVRVAWVGVNTALQRLRTTEQLVKHATEAFNLAEARYKVGSSSVIELSEAQLSQTSAEITQVNARYDTLIENAVLDYQIGSIR
ncbi:MAG: TolC family protein [Opitutaceae bacterium]